MKKVTVRKHRVFMTEDEKTSYEKMVSELQSPCFVGEDGACAVIAPNKKKALSLLKQFIRSEVGEYEARQLKYSDIVVAYSMPATEKDVEKYGSEFEWFCHWSKPTSGHHEKTYAFKG